MSEGSVSSVLLCHHCNTAPPVWTTKNAKEVLKTESAIFFTLFLISDSRNEAKTENLPYAIKKTSFQTLFRRTIEDRSPAGYFLCNLSYTPIFLLPGWPAIARLKWKIICTVWHFSRKKRILAVWNRLFFTQYGKSQQNEASYAFPHKKGRPVDHLSSMIHRTFPFTVISESLIP